jgi:hypothetical protein
LYLTVPLRSSGDSVKCGIANKPVKFIHSTSEWELTNRKIVFVDIVEFLRSDYSLHCVIELDLTKFQNSDMDKKHNKHIVFKDQVEKMDLPYKDKRKWHDEVEKWKEKEGMAMKSSYYYSTYNSIQYTTDAVPNDVEQPTAKAAVKNIIVLGVAFMFVYTAFVSLQSLQSTLNAKEGLGVASLCSIYTATLLSCFFAPWIIHKLKTKWTIIVAFGLFTIYVIIHFYPKDFMLIPTSILLGFLMGPLWIAQSTYLTTTAYNYAKETYTAYDRVVGKFNAMFCSVFQLSQIWGNILSAAVFYNDNTIVLNENSSRPHPCGAQDCGWNNDELDYACGYNSL